jgi:hypothetical protein
MKRHGVSFFLFFLGEAQSASRDVFVEISVKSPYSVRKKRSISFVGIQCISSNEWLFSSGFGLGFLFI